MNVDALLLIDDDDTLVGAWVNSLGQFIKERYKWDLSVHLSLRGLEEMIKTEKELNIRVAIVDLWMVSKANNTFDPKAGFKAIDMIRKRWPNSFIIVFSAHLDGETEKELARKYVNTTSIKKTAPESVVMREIERAVRDGQA